MESGGLFIFAAATAAPLEVPAFRNGGPRNVFPSDRRAFSLAASTVLFDRPADVFRFRNGGSHKASNLPTWNLRRTSADSSIGSHINSPSATSGGRPYQYVRYGRRSLCRLFRSALRTTSDVDGNSEHRTSGHSPFRSFRHLAKFSIFLLLCQRSGDSWVGSRITLPSVTADGKIVKPSAMADEDFSNPSDW